MKPSTEPRSGSAVGVSLGFAIVGTVIAAALVACARNSGIVEAPMMSADASASAIALASDPARSAPPLLEASDLPFKPGDRWIGSYSCNQGRSDLVLTFEEIGREDEDSIEVQALFEFHFDGNGNPGYAPSDGASRMRGKYDVKARRLRLKGEEWIDQPPNYRLVTLVGTLNKTTGTYTGTVEGPGCTSFAAVPEKKAARDAPPSLRSLPSPRP